MRTQHGHERRVARALAADGGELHLTCRGTVEQEKVGPRTERARHLGDGSERVHQLVPARRLYHAARTVAGLDHARAVPSLHGAGIIDYPEADGKGVVSAVDHL